MGDGVTAWPCGREEGMSRNPLLILNIYKVLANYPDSLPISFSVAWSLSLLSRWYKCLEMALLEKALMISGEKVGGPVFFHCDTGQAGFWHVPHPLCFLSSPPALHNQEYFITGLHK